ncbi:MAG: uridine kinase family protein [Planctomycetaceae bacterium]
MQLLDIVAPHPDDATDAACALIEAASGTGRVTLVGIDGRCGAGKTALAERVAHRLGATIVDVYDFYRPMRHDRRVALPPEEAAALLIDWRRLQAELLEPLRSGVAARYRRYDWQRCVVDGTPVPVGPEGVVIVEGVGATRRELERLLDVRIVVQTPLEVCLERVAVKRAPRVRALTEAWAAAEDWFFEHDDPASRADLIVSGL